MTTALIRRGLQCPKCFSVDTVPIRDAFQCRACGRTWRASEFIEVASASGRPGPSQPEQP